MKYSRSNTWFWASMAAGALLVTIQTVSLYGWFAIPLGIGTGGSLGMVVFYLCSMLAGGVRWLFEQLKRS